MSCRSTPANSAFTTFSQLQGGQIVPKETVLSLFHELKGNWLSHLDKINIRTKYLSELQNRIDDVTSMSSRKISDTQRATLLARFTAAEQAGIPNDSYTIYALINLSKSVKQCEVGIKQYSKDMAFKMGLPKEEVQKHFLELANSMPRTTKTNVASNRDSDWNSDESRIARSYNFGSDKALLYAVKRLNEELLAIQKKIAKDIPQRITLLPINSVGESRTTLKGQVLTHQGYDPRNERLEITIKNTLTGKSRDYAYRNVDLSQYKKFMELEEPGVYWSKRIKGSDYNTYSNPHRSLMAGKATKCLNCGQFATVGHGCPMRKEPIMLVNDIDFEPAWSNEEVGTKKIKLPTVSLLNNSLLTGAVYIDKIDQNLQGYDISGNVTLYLDENNDVKINSSQLSCGCNKYKESSYCGEIELINKALLKRTLPVKNMLNGLTPRAQEKLITKANTRLAIEHQAMIDSIMQTDWTLTTKGLREAKKNWLNKAPILYSNDFNSFKKDYDLAIMARKKAGKPVIPFMIENVLDGMATRASGQGFGVELEYEFPATMSWDARNNANDKIGQALFRLNLIPDDEQQGYHNARDNGYVDTHIDKDGLGTWSWEEDGSVDGGEIVSPIMYDEKESWENLEKVINVLKENGAIPTTRAGSHVHVGTKMYGKTFKRYAELVKLMIQHEDVIYRLGTDPKRGTHRGTEYAEPNQAINPKGFKDISKVRNESRRYAALNLAAVKGKNQDNVEFRLFDSTLDAGAVQAQVKLSVAMTYAALRVNKNGGTKRDREALGVHIKKHEMLKKLGKDITLEEDTTTLRSLLDTIFIRKEDKAQLVSIFANTKWSLNRSGEEDDDDEGY